MDKWLKIFVIIFIIGFIGVTFTIFFENYIPKKSSQSDDGYKEVQDCEKTNSKECYRSLAIRNNDLSICDKMRMSDDYLGGAENFCYVQVAVANNNVQGCFKTSNIIEGERCFFDVAINTRNPELCQNIRDIRGDLKSECIRQAS